MNPYLDDDLITLGAHVRRFASERIAPGFQERDRTRELDRALMREMGSLGFIAPELPTAFGGSGLNALAAGVIMEEVARADLSLSYINLLASLNSQILAQYGAPAVVQPWLTRMTQGEAERERVRAEMKPSSRSVRPSARSLCIWASPISC